MEPCHNASISLAQKLGVADCYYSSLGLVDFLAKQRTESVVEFFMSWFSFLSDPMLPSFTHLK